jgi:hypothetical protein
VAEFPSGLCKGPRQTFLFVRRPDYVNMWLIFSIAAGAMVLALVLAYVLKSRYSDRDVSEERVDSDTSTAPSGSILQLQVVKGSSGGAGQIQKLGVHTMTTAPVTPSRPRDSELRRSTRVDHSVPLIVFGTNRHGQPFREATSVLSMNLHGCRYSSHHEYPPEGWVTLQVTGTEGASFPQVRARVCSIYTSSSPRERCQVGVELETPANIWGIASPPEDWQRMLGISNSAAAAAPAVAPVPATGEPSETRLSSMLERHLASPDRKAEVTVFPGPTAPAVETAPAKEQAANATSQRLVLTPDQLLQALQGRLQQAADRAVQSAIASHLDEAVRSGLAKIADAWKSNVHQTEEFSAARLSEVQNRWERELVVYRSRAEEISRRLEGLAASAQQQPVDSQKILERVRAEFEPLIQERVGKSLADVSEQLESRSKQVSERHLALLTEATERAAEAAGSRFDRSAGEVRSLLESVSSSISEERIESLVNSSREYALNRMEERLSEIWRQFELQHDVARRRSEEIALQLEKLSCELREARSQTEQSAGEVRSLLSGAGTGVSAEHLESKLASAQQQSHDLLEWRLGEVSAHFERLHDAARQSSEDLVRRLEGLAAETRAQLEETKKLAEGMPHAAVPDAAAVEFSVSRASQDFETSAARISDRQLVRLMEQKQVLTREVSMELEARASETRALLQKAANTTLDDFQHRVEARISDVVAEATERMVSALSALDAESRAACETRRRAMETDVARAAEQSTAEFRSSIKAFLYSCLVAAVSAVDEHAQNTMAGLEKEHSPAPRVLEAFGAPSKEKPETRSSAASAPSSPDPNA